MYGRESDLLTRVEHQTLLLARGYTLQKKEIQRLVGERDRLLSENEKYTGELTRLREQLSMVAFALPHAPEARESLGDLRREIQEITSEVDECIALLRRGVK